MTQLIKSLREALPSRGTSPLGFINKLFGGR